MHIVAMDTSHFVKQYQFDRLSWSINEQSGEIQWIMYRIETLDSQIDSIDTRLDSTNNTLEWISKEKDRAWNVIMEDLNKRWWCNGEQLPYRVLSETKLSNWVSDYYVVSWFNEWKTRMKGWDKREVVCLNDIDLLNDDH